MSTKILKSEDPYSVRPVVFHRQRCVCNLGCDELVSPTDYTYPFCVKCDHFGCKKKKEV